MPVPRKLLREAFGLLSLRTLRVAAGERHNDIRGSKNMSRDELIHRLGSNEWNFQGCTSALPVSELNKVADLFGIHPKPTKRDKLEYALFEFILNYDSNLEKEKAKKQADTLPPMTLKELQSEAEKLNQAVLLLNPKKTGKPVAVWAADHNRLTKERLTVEGSRLWISIDMRQHPDKALRRDGVLDVFVNENEGNGEAMFRSGILKEPEGKEVYLYGTEATDFPCTEYLLEMAPGSLKKWLDQVKKKGWDLRQNSHDSSFPLQDVIDEYRKKWRAKHWHRKPPKAVYAQLGGCLVSWYDEGVNTQIGYQLVVRTYMSQEPWVEVLQKGKRYEVRVRVS